MSPRREYEFTLILAGVSTLGAEIVDALYEAGCDDATASLRLGRVYLTFSRTAESMADAVLSAIRDVHQAKVGAGVLRVDPCNLVTRSEIARRIRRTRQLVYQYITGERGPGGFPPPACYVSEDSPLWDWSEVACWLREHDMLSESEYREAQEMSLINTCLDYLHQSRRDDDLCKAVQKVIRSGETQSR